jgi:predicted DNA-binding protein
MGSQRTISFRLDEDKIAALDGLAESADRDRSYLLKEAVANYLELQAYHAKLYRRRTRGSESRKNHRADGSSKKASEVGVRPAT